MARLITTILMIFCLLTLSACGSFTPIEPTPTPSPSLTSSATLTPLPPTSTITATPQPSNTPLPPTLTPTPISKTTARYTFTVDLSYDQRTAAVQMKIDYTNRSPDALTGLRLMIPPLAYPGAFSLKALQWANGTAVEGMTWEENGLSIPLPAALQPGESLALGIAYDLKFPSAASISGDRPVPFAYTARQVNLVDWYPFVPPYQSGQGWLAHPNSYYGESLVYDLSDFDISLRLTDTRTDLVVAASAPAQIEGDRAHYVLENARSFALSISHEYQNAKTTIGGIEITSYYFAAHNLAGTSATQITAEALALFQERFAAYPHTTLAVVEAEFLDGMEYDGLYFVSRGMYNLYTGTPGEYFHALIVHETAHQWFYALVGNDQAMEPWLDEALCTYSELLYYERYHPDAVSWWWDIRINYFHPSGWVNSSVYDHLGQPGNYDLYRNAVYFNGAVFLSELRQAIGDDVFFVFLHDYTQKNTGKIATTQDFFSILSAHTAIDLGPLRAGFFKE